MLTAITARYTTTDQCIFNALATQLIRELGIPKPYFRNEAMRQAVAERTIHNWNLDRWAEDNFPLRLSPTSLKQKLNVLYRVRDLIADLSHGESYPDALNRLGDLIHHLKSKGVSYNAMAISSGEHHRTINKLPNTVWNRANSRNLRVCPWSTIRKLQHLTDQLPPTVTTASFDPPTDPVPRPSNPPDSLSANSRPSRHIQIPPHRYPEPDGDQELVEADQPPPLCPNCRTENHRIHITKQSYQREPARTQCQSCRKPFVTRPPLVDGYQLVNSWMSHPMTA